MNIVRNDIRDIRAIDANVAMFANVQLTSVIQRIIRVRAQDGRTKPESRPHPVVVPPLNTRFVITVPRAEMFVGSYDRGEIRAIDRLGRNDQVAVADGNGHGAIVVSLAPNAVIYPIIPF